MARRLRLFKAIAKALGPSTGGGGVAGEAQHLSWPVLIDKNIL